MRYFGVVVVCLFLAVSAAPAQVTGPQVLLASPCRVANSNYGAWLNGPMTPGSEFHVALRGTPAPGPSQGGANGCGVPATATAALLNVSVSSPFADGEVFAGPYQNLPAVPVLSYTAGQASNAQAWIVLAPPGHDAGFAVTATTSVTVDVVGYTVCVTDCPR